MGLEGGVNLYVYALNDPVNILDPYGLIWVTIRHEHQVADNIGKGLLNWATKKIGSGWDPGVPMSSQEEFAGMTRYVIQEWQSDCLNQDRDSEHPIGSIRMIPQTFSTHQPPKEGEVYLRDSNEYNWHPQVSDYTYQDYGWMHF